MAFHGADETSGMKLERVSSSKSESFYKPSQRISRRIKETSQHSTRVFLLRSTVKRILGGLDRMATGLFCRFTER